MTPLAWICAGLAFALGLTIVVLVGSDVSLILGGHVSLTDRLREIGVAYRWFPLVFTATVFAAVNFALGAAIGHLWLQ